MLTALADKPWFIVYDRARKCPINPETLYDMDPHDSANWMKAERAQQWATYLGDKYGVGIVLWKGCGIACIDIDKAWSGTEWSLLAQELLTRFAGAYVEVSQGGAGLHIFFSYRNDVPPHKKKNVPLHIEFYDELRFIGLTGRLAQGSPLVDMTDLLPKLIADYFKPSADVHEGGWTTEPHANWDGPADDDELIRRMCASQSAGAIFGGKASVADLWNNNVEVLARTFPSAQQGKDYDGSSADQALANHLAFWTGGNCERMYALMVQSKLNRPKWERTDYIRGTITKAADWQKTYYRQRETTEHVAPPHPVEANPVAAVAELATTVNGIPLPPNAPPAIAPPATAHGDMITASGQEILFKGCTHVEDVRRIVLPNGNALAKEQFDDNENYSGRMYIVNRDGKTTTDSAWEAFTQSKLVQFPKVRGMHFDPTKPGGSIMHRDGEKFVNTWRELDIPATAGDASVFSNHIKKILPEGDDGLILTSFLAACVQYKGVKSKWAPFIQGTPGNGKSFFSKVMVYCLGNRYVRNVRASQIDSKFNAIFYGALLAFVEDVKIADGRDSMWETLKPLITETSLEIEAKGVDAVTRDVCHNMILNSNHKDGLRKTEDDRRICPLFTAQQSLADIERDGLDGPYFIELWNWFNHRGGNAITLHYLQTFPIPDHYNFAKDAIRAPITTATTEAIDAGHGMVEQEIKAAIAEGRPGFKGGWLSSLAVGKLLDEMGKGKFIPRSKRRDMLASLGYFPHPHMAADGRMRLPLSDGTRPTLYIKRGHSAAGVEELQLLKMLYEQAQKA